MKCSITRISGEDLPCTSAIKETSPANNFGDVEINYFVEIDSINDLVKVIKECKDETRRMLEDGSKWWVRFWGGVMLDVNGDDLNIKVYDTYRE